MPIFIKLDKIILGEIANKHKMNVYVLRNIQTLKNSLKFKQKNDINNREKVDIKI